MNLLPSEEQVILRDTLGRALAKESTSARMRVHAATGHDPALWALFQELGLVGLRVAAEHGGASRSLHDAVIVSEVLAEHAASIPGVDTIVTANLLASLGGERALEQLQRLLQGGAPVTLALHDAAEQPLQLVSAAAVAEAVVFRFADEVRLLQTPSGIPEANTGGLSSKRVSLPKGAGILLQGGAAAVAAFQAAVEEWKLLTAAAIAAASHQALVNAAAYARERQAFGRPIGSFQGLAHPLAEAYADVEGASLLVLRTVEAIAAGNPAAAAMIAMCSWWSATSGVNATVKAMRAYGGYGMTLEYDAQLYFRRVTAWSLLFGDPADELRRVAERLWWDSTTAIPKAGDVRITFEYPAEAQQAAHVARGVFATHATPGRRANILQSDDGFDPELYRRLAAAGVLYPDWPQEFGGGYGPFANAAIRSVFVEYAWPHVVISVSDMLGKMLLRFGSERAKAEILPALARGEAFASLCYTEPTCGSDIFAARTTATRAGDDWLINGQKIFTSQGHLAQYGIMLARTSEADKHAGITLFALPLNQTGYRCDPIETVGTERTNTTFYENMRVPDAYRLGEVNGGVKVLASLLTIEQGSGEFFLGALQEMLDVALLWARTTEREGKPALSDPAVHTRLAAVATRIQIIDVLNRRAVWGGASENRRKHHGPSTKLFASESWITCSRDLMQLTAPFSLLQEDARLAHLERLYRRAVPSTIYAGTSEVQRSLIAEAGLGLPRSRS
jgi:3-oxochol-4-en-24-oyl-CoA dehydrogenase